MAFLSCRRFMRRVRQHSFGLCPPLTTCVRCGCNNFTGQSPLCGWRATGDLPPGALLLQSPYDPDARWSTKRNISWLGYKTHLTESCDDDLPHLVIHVETTPATTSDMMVLETIHADLAATDLLPSDHYVDAGYVEAAQVVESRTRTM